MPAYSSSHKCTLVLIHGSCFGAEVRHLEREAVPQHVTRKIPGQKTDSVCWGYKLVSDRDCKEAEAA